MSRGRVLIMHFFNLIMNNAFAIFLMCIVNVECIFGDQLLTARVKHKL